MRELVRCVSRFSPHGRGERRHDPPTGAGGRGPARGVCQLTVGALVYLDRVTVQNLPGEAFLRHRRFDVRHDRALDGARAERGIVAALRDDVQGSVGHLELDAALVQAFLHALQLQARDLLQVRPSKRAEDDAVVDAVQELGAEDVGHGLAHSVGHFCLLLRGILAVQLQAQIRDGLAPHVGRHDDDRVLEIHGAALRVRQPPVVQQLEQHPEHVRVGLLHLVEQHHAVRPPPDGLRQLPALLVAHVPRRRAREPGDGELLHVLAHVDADERVLAVEQPLSQRLRQLRLAHACGPQEQERRARPVRVAHAVARALNRLCHGADGVILADEAIVQLCLEIHQPLLVAHGHAVQRDSRLHRHDLQDVRLRDFRAALALRRRLHLLQLLLQGSELAVLYLGGARQVVAALRLRQLVLQVLDQLAHFG
mmetsp:Transcript_58070/g.165337  ORF Transcript_58070/g.165337 Transcript_58070/m.165337 type:complete len:424 (-) Transcript_58070:428-1699(-)